MGRDFSGECELFKDSVKFSEFVLCFINTNIMTERVFSKIIKIWTCKEYLFRLNRHRLVYYQLSERSIGYASTSEEAMTDIH